MYYYLRNGQNDIIGILNSSGVQVVSYVYDSWGNPISTTGTLASTIGEDNPFRYRSYYFDTDIDFYYLNSRFYDSNVGRFINADIIFSNGFLSINFYTYCLNNPTRLTDYTGFAVDKDTPPSETDGYFAPKNGPSKGKTKNGETGWVDIYGNIWVPAPDGSSKAHGGGHWDVNRRDGKGYTNRYPGGYERPGKGKPPYLPVSPSETIPNYGSNLNTGLIFVIGVSAIVVLSFPITGGQSLWILAFL
jgi:RHS repeat-associated protein